MFKMNSVLTMEERTLLQSLGCANKKHAITVLGQMIMPIPIKSEFFATAFMLKDKLEHERIDFSYEMEVGDIREEDEKIA
ncbi:MAG: hypothetical protein LKG21_07915 [Ruminococcus sp.]|jgi:hypothetical protein|nr:hypothetical protein [Ruminococcus sp.]